MRRRLMETPAMRTSLLIALGLLACWKPAGAASDLSLFPGARPLTAEGDLSAQMVAGIDRFLLRQIEGTVAQRAARWTRDFSSPQAYQASVESNRAHLRLMLGLVDARVSDPALEVISEADLPGAGDGATPYRVWAVRWTVFEGVHGEGLLLRPTQPPWATVIALPDADQTPEMLAGVAPGIPSASQFARRLAEQGCQVLVPVLVDRRDEYSGNARLKRFTNQPHREWIYRPAFEMGRTLIGYEVQKILSAVDWVERREAQLRGGAAAEPSAPIALAGYGEGGLLALHAAALDPRVRAVLVSGYFGSRQHLWEEPIYRNVFGLLTEFGDAELASLVAPRKLVVEFSEPPRVAGPPAARPGRAGAAPGKIEPPEFQSVEDEVARANTLVQGLGGEPPVELVYGAEGMQVAPGSAKALELLLRALGRDSRSPLAASQRPPPFLVTEARETQRQRRQVKELEQFTQQLMRDAEALRAARTWDALKGGNTPAWQSVCATNREFFWNQVLGHIHTAPLPLNPQIRRLQDHETWTADEVVLDVLPEVFAWGWLLRPKDLQPGEKRPVVVCQHGLEGLPEDVVTEDPQSRGYAAYKGYAAQLVRRGFIVYAPHNPYRGGDKFRTLQRKANPLGWSLFSIIIAQHQATLEWLASLPFVDPARIGFYGLSYGGKTAMRVPAVLDQYCLSICSADFNDWIQKNVTVDSGYSYLYLGEYEMPEWNLGQTFNYGEMGMLIAPRPFMVERGHDDGVAPDAWVASEFAKIRRGYVKLGLADRAQIEFFDGPHSIHGVGTFQFLHQHLRWPEPKQSAHAQPSQ